MKTDNTVRRDKIQKENLSKYEKLQQGTYKNGHIYLFFIGLLTLIYPYILELSLPLFIFIYRIYVSRPFPEHATDTSIKKNKSSSPLYCMGTETNAHQPVWFADTQMRQHMLVMGTTGAGKTEFLLFLSAQAMAQGSGVVFVDGKGDVKTWFRLYAIASRLGVEENLRILNFGTNMGPGGKLYELSNTINVFTLGDAGQLAEMMSALMAESGGDNAMWKGRAESMMRALLTALVDLRDCGEITLGSGALSDYLPLDKLATLKEHPRVKELGRTEIKRYLDALPGYNAGQQGKAEADKQHGFLTMQFTEILGLFNNAYRHIMSFALGEIDMYDVITNRRSLYVMLPSMEKSGNSVKNLGKLVVNQIRAALSKTLGAGVKGTRAEKLESRPTNSQTPILLILDEYGSYAVEGFGEVAAQARSIGVSTVFAVQDWASLEKADSKGNEAQRIWANTNTKIIMKVEDSKSTMPLVIERIKKGYVLEEGGKERDSSGLFGSKLKSQQNVSYREVDRLDPQDLFLLENGGLIVITKNRFHKVQSTYLDPDRGAWANTDYVAPSRLIPVPPPSISQIESIIEMHRSWIFTGESVENTVEQDEAALIRNSLFDQSLTIATEFPNSDPSRQSLEFLKTFFRLALQQNSKVAGQFLNEAANSSGRGSGGAYSPPPPPPPPQRREPAPWANPRTVAAKTNPYDDEDDEDSDEDDISFDSIVDTRHDFDDDPEDLDFDNNVIYPEPQNITMPKLDKHEYVEGSRDIMQDSNESITKKMIDRMMRRNDDEEDEDEEE